jgi:hypothetical protein
VLLCLSILLGEWRMTIFGKEFRGYLDLGKTKNKWNIENYIKERLVKWLYR